MDLQVPVPTPSNVACHMQAVIEWARAAAEMVEWNDGHMASLGQQLVNLLRDAIGSERGIDVHEVRKELVGVEHPDDFKFTLGTCISIKIVYTYNIFRFLFPHYRFYKYCKREN
eukprot:PhM_4_TR18715/c1_g3_i13/m.62334